MDRDRSRALLERGHDVHRTVQRIRDACGDEESGHRRRRGVLRPGQLLSAGAVPRQDKGDGDVHPPDGLLHRNNPERLPRRPRGRTLGLAGGVLRLRSSGCVPQRLDDRETPRPQGGEAGGDQGGGTQIARILRGLQNSVHDTDGADPHALLLRSDLRVDRLSDLDADLPFTRISIWIWPPPASTRCSTPT